MNRISLRNINIKYILFYLLPLSLIFYGTLTTLYGQNNIIFDVLLRVRAASIILCTIIGYALSFQNSGGSLSKTALLFSVYCFIITLFTANSSVDFLSIGATIFFWPITILIGEKSYFKKGTYDASSYIIAIICNLMSFTYIYGRTNVNILLEMDHNQSVAAINSIYLILSTFPFVFLVPNKILRVTFLILPLFAFFLASKTTCLLAGIISVLYYFLDDLIHSKHKIQIVILFILIVVSIFYFGQNIIDISVVLEDVTSDYDSGGNGRLSIIENVLNYYANKDFIYQLFGSGFNAVSSDTPLSAHNDFLEILYDYGIVGIIFYLTFWIQLFKRRKRFPIKSNIYIIYNISLIIYLICCLASNFIVMQINMLFFALLWGTIDKYKIIYKD